MVETHLKSKHSQSDLGREFQEKLPSQGRQTLRKEGRKDMNYCSIKVNYTREVLCDSQVRS